MAVDDAPARWRDRLGWAAYPVSLFLFTRVALVGLSAVSMRLWPGLFKYPERRQAFLEAFPSLDGLCRWDCGLYLKVAEQGYQQFLDANIWPAYPLLIRLVSTLTFLPPHIAALLIASAASLASFLVIFWLFRELGDERAARTGLTLFAAYPFAFFQAAGYPESLMVLASAGAIALTLRGRHQTAGAVVALGLLARHLTALAGLSLLVRQLRERPTLRGFFASTALVGLLLPFVALAGWALFLHLRLGNGLAFLEARAAGWGPEAWRSVPAALWHAPQAKLVAYAAFSLLPGVGALLLLRDRRHWELAALAVPLWLVTWAFGAEALGRYSAACWPAFLPLGAWLAARPALATPTVVALALFQGLFATLFMHQFPIV